MQPLQSLSDSCPPSIAAWLQVTNDHNTHSMEAQQEALHGHAHGWPTAAGTDQLMHLDLNYSSSCWS